MLFLNFKLPKKVLSIAIFVFVVVLALLIGIVKRGNIDSFKSDEECSINEELTIEDYITSFGPQIDVNSCVIDTVIIPKEFNEVYSSYNELQKSQGFDLERYKGFELLRHTYSVVNYPDSSKTVYVEVLVYDDRVVAADIYSTDSDGFIMPLK